MHDWIRLINYALIRLVILPFAYLPLNVIRRVGAWGGTFLFWTFPKYRKRALSNLALATNYDEETLIALAKESLQNLVITCLEYPKLARIKRIQSIAHCVNPEKAAALLHEKRGVIFFCGHQSNWEILFLEGTSRMKGVAIGRPIANHYLYRWITQIRERFGGKMIAPKEAVRAGLRALKQETFLGIVGDQGMPDSGYHSPFFGKQAWTSPLPALLSYKTGCPIIVATTKREKRGYRIHYSDPIFPNTHAPLPEEIDRLMHQALHLLEMSIRENPGEWLWTHNRWKQQLPGKVKKRYRHETILIILPKAPASFLNVLEILPAFRELYPHEFITLFVPREQKGSSIPIHAEKIYYDREEELFLRDYCFKLIFNFAPVRGIKRHYLNLAAFTVVDLQEWKNLCRQSVITLIKSPS